MVENSSNLPNLYLVGFMGTGKTTIGRHLARCWHYTFIDSDAAIESATGQTVSELFAQKGEAFFRKLEKDFIENGHPQHRCIIACGGGMVTQSGIIEKLKSKGVVICLFASPQTIQERTSRNKRRPLLNVPDPEKKIQELLKAREPYYKNSGIGILTDRVPLAELCAQIERIYRRQARLSAKLHPASLPGRP